MTLETKRELKAVHSADLINLLQKLDIHEGFMNGEFRCSICGDSINLTNVGSMKKIEGEIRFTCSKPTCYNEVVKTMKD